MPLINKNRLDIIIFTGYTAESSRLQQKDEIYPWGMKFMEVILGIEISDRILQEVEKPPRYTGNEWNIVKKDLGGIDIRFAFCFPDVYEIGMSHLGMKILYHLLNERKDTYCERVFAPWIDMEAKMKEYNIPLFSLETRDPVKNSILLDLHFNMKCVIQTY